MFTDILIKWLTFLQHGFPFYDTYNFLIQITIYLSVTALLIILFKSIFKNKLSAKWHVLIWAILLVRFVVPVLPSSEASIFNATKIDEQAIIESSYRNVVINFEENDIEESDIEQDYVDDDGERIDIAALQKKLEEEGSYSYSRLGYTFRIDAVIVLVWGSVAMLLLGYFVIVLSVYNRKLKMNRKDVDDATLEILSQCKERLRIKRDVKVYFAETTPMLIGLFRPTIYIPEGNSESETRDTLLHELSHMKNLDVLWSMFATFLLCLNWFNPIMWVSFFMFKRDIEVFCDERTLRYADDKQSYARLLLKTATVRKEKFVLGTTSLQSGKADVKRRIKYMAKFRKPAVATVVVAGVLISILSACCLTNPLKDKLDVTVTNPVNGCKIDLIVDRNIAKSNITCFENVGNLKFESDMTIEEIAKTLCLDNMDFGYNIVGDKDVLLRNTYTSECVPYLLLTKSVRAKSGEELDDVVFLECIGTMDNIVADNSNVPNNIPNIKYGFYFPDYLVDGFRYDNYDREEISEEWIINTSNPFKKEIQLRDSEDNFKRIENFYTDLYAYTTTKEDENGGGEILIEDNQTGDPLFKIFYNGKDKTVRFKAYAAFAADSAKGVIRRLENAINRQDRELLASCFENFTDEDYKNFSKISKDLILQKLTIGKFDNAKKIYYFNTLAQLEPSQSGNSETEGTSHYSKHFKVEYFGEESKITYTDIANDDDFVSDYYSPDRENPNLFINETLGEPDLSDLDNSSGYSEIPDVIYADNKTAIISGGCGIVVYSLKQRAITLWASSQYLRELGMSIPFGIASADGKQVYIRDGSEDIAGSESVNGNWLSLILDVEKRTITDATGDFPETFERYSMYNLSMKEKSAYDIDEKDVGGTYITFKKNIVYTYCPYWVPKDLTLVKFNKETGRKEEYKIFQS
ncbi:MAG: hypothetical protein J1E96_04930 [Ruminococcus sp.]|nr:hypothetical protein [Ruminococcus sp.]